MSRRRRWPLPLWTVLLLAGAAALAQQAPQAPVPLVLDAGSPLAAETEDGAAVS